MNKFVEGSYNSIEDAIQAIDTLVMRGHSKDDMTLVTNPPKKEELGKDSPLSISTYDDQNDDSDILAEYKDDIENGELVVLVKEKADEDTQLSNDMNNREADIANDRSKSGPSTSTDQSEATHDVDLGDDLSNSTVNPGNNQSNDDIGL